MKSQGIPNQADFPRTLTTDDVMFRAVHPTHLKDDVTVSSAAFVKNSKDTRMSVDWASLSTPRQTYDRWPQWGDDRAVAAVAAWWCWEAQQIIQHTPTDDNPSHSDVYDRLDTDLPTRRIQKTIAEGSVLIWNCDGAMEGSAADEMRGD